MTEKRLAEYAADTDMDLDFIVASALDLVDASEEEAGPGYGVLRHLMEAMAEPASNAPSAT